MKFSEELRRIRLEQQLSQADLAKRARVGLKSISNYESGATLPRTLEIYERLANVLGCAVEDLLCEDERFILAAKQKYGSRGKAEAQRLVHKLTGLFAGGEMAPEDMEEMMLAVQEAYFIAKLNNQKYTPERKRVSRKK